MWLSSAEPRLLGADLQSASPWLQRDILAGLRTAFPLLHFKPSEMQLLRQRRCRACVVVTHRMRRIPRLSLGERAARLGVAADQRGEPRQLASQIPSGRRKRSYSQSPCLELVCSLQPVLAGLTAGAGPKVLSQVVCVLQFRRNGQPSCNLLRPVAAHDVQHGLPSNAVVMQVRRGGTNSSMIRITARSLLPMAQPIRIGLPTASVRLVPS